MEFVHFRRKIRSVVNFFADKPDASAAIHVNVSGRFFQPRNPAIHEYRQYPRERCSQTAIRKPSEMQLRLLSLILLHRVCSGIWKQVAESIFAGITYALFCDETGHIFRRRYIEGKITDIGI